MGKSLPFGYSGNVYLMALTKAKIQNCLREFKWQNLSASTCARLKKMGSGWEQASWQEKRYIYAIYDVTLCNLVPLIFHSPSLCSEVLVIQLWVL